MATKKSRKNPRAQVSLLARYRSPTAFEYVNEECFDLSTGGMFIKSPTPAPTGTLLKLECAVNGGVEMLRGVARVVWLRESESDGQPSGMGVKFVKLEQGSREIIHRILVERGSIEPGELEALRPSSVAPAAVLEARVSSGGGAVSALAARSATLPPEMRATVPDGGLLRESREREVEDVTDEVTSAESDPPANASSAPLARVSANGTAAAHAGAKAVVAKPITGTRPSARAPQPAAPAKQRTGIVVVLLLVAAAAAAAIMLSRPAPAPKPSAAVIVSVPVPEPAAIEPALPAPSVPAAQPETESASAEAAAVAPPTAVEPAPARPPAREPERAAAVSRTTSHVQPREAEPAAEPAPETEPTPAPEPVLVATGSSAAPVALTAEGAPLAATPQPAPSPTPAPAAYVLTVVTTPAGAQVTAAGQAGLSPCRFELGALETKIEVQANLAGYSPAVAVIDRIGFMLDDGRMRRRISLTLHPVPQAMPDPEPVAKPSRHRPREAREPESEPKPAAQAPAGTPMQAAMACLTTGDNACAVNALEGKARNAQELELLIETYRTLGNSAKAERWMNAYVEKYPAERRANTYRRQLERRQSEAPP